MGNVYRFVEPVVLLLLRKKGRSYGYELSQALQDHALTDAEVERAALYRTLRQLEVNGNVVSEWETDTGGPARRVYSLTADGEHHLAEWAEVLGHLSKAMSSFVATARSLDHDEGSRPNPGAGRPRRRPPAARAATGRLAKKSRPKKES
jgi:PadR family transcriptional regulator, regulatory protein PadR